LSSEMCNRRQDLKLLGGMLALRRFTYAELAAHAGVPEGSVRSFLSRRSGLVDEDEKVSIGGSGRPAKRWRLNDEAASKVAKELRALTGHLVRDLGPQGKVESALERSEPRSLVMLEQTVGRLATAAVVGAEREESLEEAQLQARLTIAALDDREEVLGRAEHISASGYRGRPPR
jgi:predicted ArsR family transcriptional regulator